MGIREISKILESRPTIEGAGFHLKRAFVMNTQEELDTAFQEYRNGNFIKKK